MTTPAEDRRTVATPPGGILTREVGAITGEVEVWLECGLVRVCYVGAEEVYTVLGRPGERGLDEVVELLTADPGVDADDNPVATRLP